VLAAPIAAQSPPAPIPSFPVQPPRFSTHDWGSTPAVAPIPNVNAYIRNEGWADVKTPGDGRTYAVGTMDAYDTRDTSSPTFSLVAVANPPVPIPSFAMLVNPLPNTRQIVILQVSSEDGAIVWQQYLYGESPVGTDPRMGRANNARGISVWPAADRSDTRIAICGETYDRHIPLSQGDNLAGSDQHAAGFIAVYNGLGALLWTHHFFGDPAAAADCAITDVSIRVQGGNDIVTYCGISTHGVPAVAGPLSPFRPFIAPAALGCAGQPASGSTNNGQGQWDGIVGRLVRPHDGSGTTTTVFHSIVGGREQDGLFGIAEADESRVVVVGSTASQSTATGNTTFPVTELPEVWNGTAYVPTCLPTAPQADHCLGVVLLFNTSPTMDSTTPGPLVLVSSTTLGTIGTSNTAARDVAIGTLANGINTVAVVGSTDDAAMLGGFDILLGASFQPNHGGGVDGFIAYAGLLSTPPLLWITGSYFGGTDNEFLTGVGSWNEYSSTFVVGGGASNAAGDDLVAATVGVDGQFGVFSPLLLLHTAVVGGTGGETPAALGTRNATSAGFGLQWDVRGIGQPAGGGISMDPRARVHLVGATASADYPVLAGGRGRNSDRDAVRTLLDMLPQGVGRTDGTGLTVPIDPSATGGTTPACALAPFGAQIGGPQPALRRMLIDYLGPAPAQGVQPFILVDRFEASTVAVAEVLRVGFPSPLPNLSIPGVELWVDPASATILTFTGSLQPLGPLVLAPPSSFTVQVLSLLSIPVGCPGTTTTFSIAATPALVISY
jgi:hypothetical protein